MIYFVYAKDGEGIPLFSCFQDFSYNINISKHRFQSFNVSTIVHLDENKKQSWESAQEHEQ